jgi:hypothetical protein
MMQFKRYQTLIVIHANHNVVVAAGGLMEKAIRREGTIGLNAFPLGRADGGSDDLFLLVAEDSVFAAVRIQGGDRDPGASNGKEMPQAPVYQLQRRGNFLSTQAARNLAECDMAGYRHDAKFFSDQHHAALGGPAQLSKQLGMAGIIVTRVLENPLADGSRCHGIGNSGQGELGGYNNVPVRGMATRFGWAAGA